MAEELTSGIAVAEWLRERIRKGRLIPGQRLVEIDIMDATGASRYRVREGFQRLEAEGLVSIEEFRGASVRKVSVAEVSQTYRARMALEGICAADCALHASEEQRASLRAIQDQLDETVTQGAPDRFGQLNQTWHELVITGSGNQVAKQILDRISIPVNRMVFESFYDEGRLRTANADHRAITDAILARDGDESERRMRRHIIEGFATLSEIIGDV